MLILFVVMLCAVLAVVFYVLILKDREKVIHTENSLYRDIEVYESRGERYMRFSRKRSSRQTGISLTSPDRPIVTYTKMMLGALYLNPVPLRILIIGLGGGALAGAVAAILPAADIDIVEIDPAVIHVAKKYFYFRKTSKIRIYAEDGRAFARSAGKRGIAYDMIMLDAYDDQYIPGHMLTREFLTELKRILNPGGVLSANTWKSSRAYDNESVTYEAVFGRFFSLLKNNRVILACNNGLPDLNSIRKNAELLEPKLTPLGINASYLLPLFSTGRNWDVNAVILTDQNISSIHQLCH